jgi:hypothetical protein
MPTTMPFGPAPPNFHHLRDTTVDFERVQNGERGLFVTVTKLDRLTGEVSTESFGRTIPTADRPTIAFDVTINPR